MIKEIIVAGIKLNSYTALENLTKIGKRMDNNVFTTVEEVYMGDGKIVHASNKKDGIKITNNWKYKKVLAIRRIF